MLRSSLRTRAALATAALLAGCGPAAEFEVEYAKALVAAGRFDDAVAHCERVPEATAETPDLREAELAARLGAAGVDRLALMRELPRALQNEAWAPPDALLEAIDASEVASLVRAAASLARADDAGTLYATVGATRFVGASVWQRLVLGDPPAAVEAVRAHAAALDYLATARAGGPPYDALAAAARARRAEEEARIGDALRAMSGYGVNTGQDPR